MSEFPWPLFGALATLFACFSGILVTVISGLLKSNQRHADRRFESIEKALDAKSNAVASLQTALAEHKLHVSENYVHREDYVRLEGSKSVLLSNLKEAVGTVNADIARLTTLVNERLPASQGS